MEMGSCAVRVVIQLQPGREQYGEGQRRLKHSIAPGSSAAATATAANRIRHRHLAVPAP
jgi:hypothetical protein